MSDNVVITCVYCGHEYPAGTPASGASILTDHIKVCDKHPMRKMVADCTKLRAALVGLVGVSETADLQEMEAAMRLLPAPEHDKAVTINAIHALLETAP